LEKNKEMDMKESEGYIYIVYCLFYFLLEEVVSCHGFKSQPII